MIELYKNRITIEKLVSDGKSITIDRHSSYIIAYPEFLKYFNSIEVISKHNLIVAIHFTYGWMPTIFDFRIGSFEEVLQILNDVKKGGSLNIRDLKTLKSFLNNSLVGTSKLLHFINPEKYAIWDSRVYRYLTGHKPYDHRISNCASFLSYLEFCEFLTNQNQFDSVHSMIIDKLGYQVTKFRTAELVMFSHGNSSVNS